jgi:hypothetical protein
MHERHCQEDNDGRGHLVSHPAGQSCTFPRYRDRPLLSVAIRRDQSEGGASLSVALSSCHLEPARAALSRSRSRRNVREALHAVVGAEGERCRVAVSWLDRPAGARTGATTASPHLTPPPAMSI